MYQNSSVLSYKWNIIPFHAILDNNCFIPKFREVTGVLKCSLKTQITLCNISRIFKGKIVNINFVVTSLQVGESFGTLSWPLLFRMIYYNTRCIQSTIRATRELNPSPILSRGFELRALAIRKRAPETNITGSTLFWTWTYY